MCTCNLFFLWWFLLHKNDLHMHMLIYSFSFLWMCFVHLVTVVWLSPCADLEWKRDLDPLDKLKIWSLIYVAKSTNIDKHLTPPSPANMGIPLQPQPPPPFHEKNVDPRMRMFGGLLIFLWGERDFLLRVEGLLFKFNYFASFSFFFEKWLFYIFMIWST